MTREEAKRRVMARMQGGSFPRGRMSGMGSRDWLLRWYFGEAEAQKITQLLASVRPMIDAVRSIATGLPDKVRSVYVNKLDAYSRSLDGLASSAASRNFTSAGYDSSVKQLSVTWPAELVALRNLAQRDVATAGQASAALAKQVQEANVAANKALETNILVHPVAAGQAAAQKVYEEAREAGATALEAGEKAAAAALDAVKKVADKATDTAVGIQWGILKKAWPFLALAGGALVLIYFGPVLGKIASRMIGSGRAPGMLPPGTMHQPGE